MKKNYFLGALLISSSLAFGQKTLFLNGGQFGNASENANLMIYDPVVDSTRLIDKIETGSVQEILTFENEAIVLAQDSIIRYDIQKERRMVAAAFRGTSTKALEVAGQELLVGNFYGQSKNNLEIYNRQTLAFVDTITEIAHAVKSILVHNGFAYIPQNASVSFKDTLGYILKYDVANRSTTDTIRVNGYTEEFGQLIFNSDQSGFLSLNPNSNTITRVDFNTLSASNTSIGISFSAGGESNFSRHNDTLFIKTGNGISAINLNTLAITDSNIVDTVVTGFSYDTLNQVFYVTQTDFFSYNIGKSYSRQGVKINDIQVGFSPEVVRVYYGSAVSVAEINPIALKKFNIYPNPTSNYINLVEPLSSEESVLIRNINGALMKQLNGNSTEFYVGDLPAGTYIVQRKSPQAITNTRLVITK